MGLESDNSDNLCHVLEDDLEVEEEDCTNDNSFLCQFECGAPNPLRCSDGSAVPDGYFSMFGNFYQKSSSQADHDDAQSNCIGLKGVLATVANEADYQALLVLAAVHRANIHIGLENPDGTFCGGVNDTCNGDLYWRQGDDTLLPFDDSYVSNGISAAANDGCFVIDQGSDYEIVGGNCVGSNEDYFCQFQCPVSCPEPAAIDNAANNWSNASSSLGDTTRQVLG